MTIRINDIAPNFTAQTTHGAIDFHEWLGDGWACFVSHPKDFTPVCTTELGLMAHLDAEFAKRGVRMIGHSVDSLEHHDAWMCDIEETQGVRPQFPIIGDESLEVAKIYEMLPADAIPGSRTAVENATVRAVYIIGPGKKIRSLSFYPMSTGRNFYEILRSIDSMQLADKHKVVTPVNWEPGDAVLIPPFITNEEATRIFPQGWTTKKPPTRHLFPSGGPMTAERSYLRYVNV